MKKQAAKNSLLRFACLIDPEYKTPAHICSIAEALERVERGEIRRLIVNMPPGMGKSRLVSQFFPAWLLARRDRVDLILSAYAGTLVEDFSQAIKQILETEQYQTMFHVKQSADSKSKSRWTTNTSSRVIAVGIGGPITGRRCHFAIVDDPIKNEEEAMSQALLDKHFEWYRSTLLSRLHPMGSIIVAMTRWVVGDLSGRLLEAFPGDWHHLKIPAINESGESIWPEKFPIGDLIKMRAETGGRWWPALWQQDPRENISDYFPDMQWEELPLLKDGTPIARPLMFIDPAFGGPNDTAYSMAAKHNDLFYVTAGDSWNSPIDKSIEKIKIAYELHKPYRIAVEANADKGALYRELVALKMPAVPVTNTIHKGVRIEVYVRRNWSKLRFSKNIAGVWVKHLLAYSEGKEPDDVPDSLAGAMAFFVQRPKTLRPRLA